MRKIKIYNKMILLAALSTLVSGQVTAQGISCAAPRLLLEGGRVTLTLEVKAGSAVKSDARVVLTPVLEGAAGILTFPPVVVEGRGARISRERAERSGILDKDETVTRVAAGTSASYTGTIDAGEWRGAGRLSVKLSEERCGCEVPGLLALAFGGEIVLEERRPVERVAVAPPVEVPVTVARALETAAVVARENTFVERATPGERQLLDGQGTRAAWDRYVDEHRGTALTVYFRVNDSSFDPLLGANEEVMERLVATVEELLGLRASGVRVGVLLVGFSSPEGDVLLNDRLARARALSVRRYIESRTRLAGSDILVHGGGADWKGLRELVVESREPWRDEVLRVIDTRPAWDPVARVSRMDVLKAIGNGAAYRYISRNFFPRLRNAAFIKVFYDTAGE